MTNTDAKSTLSDRLTFLILALALSGCATASPAAADLSTLVRHPETSAVERAVLDYFEGWFDGNVERVTLAMHADLAKRTLTTDGGTEVLRSTTAARMIAATGEGIGKGRDVPDRQIQIYVIEIYEPMATVVVHSAVYREYLHLVKTRDGWKIVNALWRRTN